MAISLIQQYQPLFFYIFYYMKTPYQISEVKQSNVYIVIYLRNSLVRGTFNTIHLKMYTSV